MFLKTHFTNFINLDVSRVTGFPEFPNTRCAGPWLSRMAAVVASVVAVPAAAVAYAAGYVATVVVAGGEGPRC
jgi:hypothetical protein